MPRPALTFGGWQGVVGVDFAFEPCQEGIPAGLGPCRTVRGATPRDVCRDLLVQPDLVHHLLTGCGGRPGACFRWLLGVFARGVRSSSVRGALHVQARENGTGTGTRGRSRNVAAGWLWAGV